MTFWHEQIYRELITYIACDLCDLAHTHTHTHTHTHIHTHTQTATPCDPTHTDGNTVWSHAHRRRHRVIPRTQTAKPCDSTHTDGNTVWSHANRRQHRVIPRTQTATPCDQHPPPKHTAMGKNSYNVAASSGGKANPAFLNDIGGPTTGQ